MPVQYKRISQLGSGRGQDTLGLRPRASCPCHPLVEKFFYLARTCLLAIRLHDSVHNYILVAESSSRPSNLYCRPSTLGMTCLVDTLFRSLKGYIFFRQAIVYRIRIWFYLFVYLTNLYSSKAGVTVRIYAFTLQWLIINCPVNNITKLGCN